MVLVQPLAIDLFCGLGGWTDGLLAEGWDVVGFDIEQHIYGEHRYPAQLVLQDVRTLHGSQFRSADLIVASPPCQFFSYCAMPWSRAKALANEVRSDPDRLTKELELFMACFRLQREACKAAGRHIPLIVENVRGAIPWVGRSRWAFGSFHLWGDVPALMPPIKPRSKRPGHDWNRFKENGEVSPHWRLDGEDSRKLPGFRFDGSGQIFQSASVEGVKQGGDWFRDPTCPTRQGGQKGRKYEDGVKQPGINLSEIGFNVANAHEFGSLVEGIKIVRSAEDKRQHIGTKRKFASAMIAKIPPALSQHIARCFRGHNV